MKQNNSNIIKLPKLNVQNSNNSQAPDYNICVKFWDKYNVLANIREHSTHVANIGKFIAELAYKKNKNLEQDFIANTYAAGLLHDIAKSYTIKYGGSHAQIGASIALDLIQNYSIANAVLNHVLWVYDDYTITEALIILYADKRVKHANIVNIKDRFEDLLERYGTNEVYIQSIKNNYIQALEIEKYLSDTLEFDLCTYF